MDNEGSEEEEDEEEEETEIQPKKWEEEVKRVVGVVAKCVQVYEECRRIVGTEYIMEQT